MSSKAERTRVERLTTLRDTQESALASGVPTREFAALSREYRATLAEIESLTPAAPKGDLVDEIAKRRAARGAGSAKSQRRSATNQG